jgi:hypothetical protein
MKPFIPQDAEWYVATLVFSISVGSRRRVTVHRNTVLVEARTPQRAFQRALALGRRDEQTYENVAGERVRFRFLGLRELAVVHDRLEHGAELFFSEDLDQTLREARGLTRPKRALGVFAPRRPRRGPDYASGEVMRALEKVFGAPPARPRARRQRSKS